MLRPRSLVLLLLLALGGCGGASANQSNQPTTTTTAASTPATPQSVQACLERLGYEIADHRGNLPTGDNSPGDLDVLLDIQGYGPSRLDEFQAIGGSGQGEATVSIYDSSERAQKAATEALHAVEESEAKYKESLTNESIAPRSPASGKPGWSKNVAFVAWADAALASENIASCVS
jgi:hypothetical protein